MRTTTPRVRAGVPAGGQFAPINRPEATGVELLDDPGPGGAALDGEAILAEATRWGTRYARRYGADAAEVIGEVAVRFYERRAGLASAAPVRNDVGYLRTLAHSIAIQAIGAERSYVRQAWRTYQARCDEAMQRLGHGLSRAQEDEIAASVVAAQEPRRRAPAGFHRKRHVVSLDGPAHRLDAHDRGVAIATSLRGPDDTEALATGRDRALGPLGEMAERLAAAGDHAGARRLAWDAFAELVGAPAVEASSVTEREAATARKAVADAGGAGALAGDHAAGLTSPERSEALFKPFGKLADDERDAVVAALSARRPLADELWDLALRAATKRRGGSHV